MTYQLYRLVVLFLWLHCWQGDLNPQPLATYLNFSPLDTRGGFSVITYWVKMNNEVD